jgi:hypothetical protein
MNDDLEAIDGLCAKIIEQRDRTRTGAGQMTQPRTIFAEEFSSDRFLRIVVYGDWDNDMADTLKSFIERRQRRSAPADSSSLPSGESSPAVMPDLAGADTLICPVTGSPCTTEQDEFCEDYGCARKAGIDVDHDLTHL